MDPFVWKNRHGYANFLGIQFIQFSIFLGTVLLFQILGSVYADEGDFENHQPGRPRGNELSERPANLKLELLRFTGSACPPEHLQVGLNSTGLSFSFLFDQFVLQTPFAEKNSQIKECSVTLKMQVPAGFQASLTRMDYRGFQKLDKGSKSILSTSTLFADLQYKVLHPEQTRRHVFKGPLEENFIISSKIRPNLHWSPCGQSFLIHLKTSLGTELKNPQAEASSSLDSIDGSASAIEYHLLWQRCQKNQP